MGNRYITPRMQMFGLLTGSTNVVSEIMEQEMDVTIDTGTGTVGSSGDGFDAMNGMGSMLEGSPIEEATEAIEPENMENISSLTFNPIEEDTNVYSNDENADVDLF